MSLDNLRTVDVVGTEKDGNAVVLHILDSWDWDEPYKHLVALQDKINTYLAFVESGQIYEEYPSAKGRTLRIDILSRFPMPNAGYTFLKKASAVAAQLNIGITQRVI